MADPTPTVVWQGAVNLWECDQMEHWNTRFYMEALEEGLAGLARLLGCDATSLTVQVADLRFLREARVGTNMALSMGVVSAEGADIVVRATLASPEGGPVHAAYLLRVRSAQPLDVPHGLRLAAPPAEHAPRDVPFEAGAPAMPDLGDGTFRRVAAGTLMPAACDGAGTMRLSHPLARLSEGLALLMHPRREVVVAHASPGPARVGGATLEARFDMFDPARLGSRLELWSAVAALQGKVFRVESWLIEPDAVRPVALIRSVSVVLDLDARAAVAVTPQAAAELARRGLVARA